MTHTIYSLIDTITTMIQTHPESSQWIVFSIAFIESMAILGSIFPGTFLLTPVGIMLGSGVLPPLETFISILMGAFLGDGISYLIGLHYHPKVESLTWIKKHQGMYDWFKTFMQKYGVLSLVIGRFVGPLRSSVPLFAGLLGMQYITFLLGIIPSIILWGIAYLGPGFIIGRPVVSQYLQQNVLPLFEHHFIAWLVVSLFLTLSIFCPKDKSDTLKTIKQLLQMLAIGSFLIITVDQQLWSPLNQVFLTYSKILPSDLSQWISSICDATNIIPILGMVMIYDYVQKCCSHRGLLLPTQNLGLGSLLLLLVISVPLMKSYMLQVRPALISSHLSSAFNPANDYSFPSGHLTLWTALWVYGAHFISHRSKMEKILYIASACLGGLTLAISRLSLLEHWISDILGGIALGTTLALLAYILHLQCRSTEHLSFKRGLYISLGIIVIGSIRYIYHV